MLNPKDPRLQKSD